MEEKVAYSNGNGNGNGKEKEKILTTDVDQMSDKELELLGEIIGRDDIEDSLNILILGRTDNFDETEIMVFFKDELFIRCKKKEETTLHNESLGIDRDFKFEWDSAMSVRREDISSISVFRPPLCPCDSCAKEREKGGIATQPDYYLLEIMTASKDHSAKIYDKEGAFMLQDYVRRWRFQADEFAPRKNRKKNK